MKARAIVSSEVGTAFMAMAHALPETATKRGRRAKTRALIKALRGLDLLPAEFDIHGFGIGSDRNGDSVVIVYGEEA